MATIQRFEDLICWQRARELANFVFDITDKPMFKDFTLKQHFRKTSISPMSNIAEGFDRGTRAEFIDALFIAKGEAGEVKCQLYLSYDRHYVSDGDFECGLRLCEETSRLIQSFVNRVKGGAHQGTQFKKVQKPDPYLDVLKTHAPDIYERFYKERG